MHKKLRELLDAINGKKTEIVNLVNEGKVDEAKTAKDELQKLQDEFDLLKDVLDVGPVNPVPAGEPEDAVHRFAEAARHGFSNTYSGNNGGTGADGGYAVPADIQARINKLKEARFSLADMANTENVTTMSGRRTYKTRAQHTGFSKVGEAAAIGKKAGPTFGAVEYKIDKYAGYLPVTNELLDDSDESIVGTLTEWLADEDIATRNNLIIAAIKTKAETAFAGIDDIKKAVNVTLGSKFAGSVSIVTNDDGLQYLDTLKDTTGRSLLSANANGASPMSKVLACGATNIPVVVVPNEVLATTGTKIPFYVGSLKDYACIFDRQKITIGRFMEASTADVNAFEQDLTLFRAIDRLDCEVYDAGAMVNGYITKN